MTLLVGGCAGTEQDGTAAPASSASTAADNTAEICASGGKAARDVVLNLFSSMADVAEEKDPEAALTKVYNETFTKLADQMRTEAGRASDPAFAAILTGIADESAKVAANPEAADTSGFQESLTGLDKYCPREGAPSAAPGDAANGGVVDGVVGAAGSGCELPVTFKVTEKWKPKAVDIAADDPLADLVKKGNLRLICEIDGKPAGHVGFLRVWTGPASAPKAALKPLVSEGKTRKVKYSTVTAGGFEGVEVAFEQYQKLLEEWLPNRAMAVRTGDGVVVLDLGGLDAAEHKAMLPTFELAKTSMAAK
ncbi:lipoprotein [Actinoplanes sp. DH11]|uniref:lipoprotein n=1 Tax=Actinoplanes sp. DH11 TaxID=2857011 RepID=UPI001E59B0D4|nr:lipoprotein [Actinoplanes sp. DH11]